MGYPPNQKGFLLYNLQMKCLMVSRHVTFFENKFPLHDSISIDQQGVTRHMTRHNIDSFIFDNPDFPRSIESEPHGPEPEHIDEGLDNDHPGNETIIDAEEFMHRSGRPVRDRKAPTWLNDYICMTDTAMEESGKTRCRAM
ncbi:uncharacterized protein LOC114712703 [Neltuma alba]|uniref:uncharacterized protein LOC114712703 n=1 Tax=Neltuma alba TaxID=207710 RepID=UPI0010A39449|nr:uncharacterized protein LOC114712703 [Prosopis alba]